MRRLSSIQGFLVDLDGTLYVGNRVIAKAPEFIESLKRLNKSFLIVSNNSSMSRESYKNKLQKLGIDVTAGQIFTSTMATALFLQRRYPGSLVYPVGTPEFEIELRANGIQLSKNEADIVVLGFDKTLTYEKIAHATRLIRDGALFVATHADRFCPTENGMIPDIGPMIALFTSATDVSPKTIGKPNSEMIEGALSLLKLSAAGVAMVGDRVYTDLKMAQDFGLTSVLVLSGEAQRTDLKTLSSMPDYIFESVGDIIGEL
jgi:HAD superfamily hydrolase (TIGR01457 family)